MTLIGKALQQPNELLSYEVSFVSWLADRGLTASSATVSVEDGLTLHTYTLVSGVVRFWVSGGTSGQTYKATVRLICSPGDLRKEAEVKIAIREV